MQVFTKAYSKSDNNVGVKIGDIITCSHRFEEVLVTQIISINVEKDWVYIVGSGIRQVEN